MPLPTIVSGNVASATASTTYDVANSCRFDAASDAYMHKTPGSAGNTGLKKFTFSTWVKRCGVATEQTLIRTKDGSNVECIEVTADIPDIIFHPSDNVIVISSNSNPTKLVNPCS